MRYVQICNNVMSGSVGRIARQNYEEKTKKGDECLLCYGRGKEPKGYNYYKIDSRVEVLFHVGMARLFDCDGLWSRHATKKLINRLKEFEPDVVHLHCLHGYYLNYPILFKYLSQNNIKVIWTMHDCWAFTGHCAYFTMVNCNKWKTGCHDCEIIKEYPKCIAKGNEKRNYILKRKVFNSIKQESMQIITPSRWLKDLIKLSFLKKYKVKVIYNDINTDVFKLSPSDFKIKNHIENKWMILGVANGWDERKGLDDFLYLATHLDKKYQIVMVGLNEKQIKEMPDNIIGIMRTKSPEELAMLYTAADVFVNPTHADNYPTVNLEAQACGTKTITYNIGGSIETLRKDLGYYTKADPETLRKKIMEICEASGITVGK